MNSIRITARKTQRWAVLGTFMGINLTIQTLWISYSPIVGSAAAFYGVTDMQISFIAMVFMLAFIPLSIPVSWAIDRFGFRWPVTFGAMLMGICGLVRGLAGANYTVVLLASVGMAIAQPFLLNAWTKVPANWLPRKERAGAVGLITLASLVGTALGQVLPPVLLDAGVSIPKMQLYFGVAAFLSACAFLAVARERPADAEAGGDVGTRVLMLDGLKHAFSVRAFRASLIISFIGLGFFNGINTWIEPIIRPRGFSSSDAGMIGALMVVSGLAGAVIMPALSDKEGKRRKYLVIALAGCLPGIIGVTFATGAPLLYASAIELGFFLMSTMPITMQYAAEIAAPTPEGTSNGLIQLFGQGAVVFVYLMGVLRMADGSFTLSLLLMGILFIVSIALASRLPEPTFAEKPQNGKSLNGTTSTITKPKLGISQSL